MSTQPEGVVVLGVPRSGTTLLRRLLDAHPEIDCPGETNLLVGASRMLAAEPVIDGLEIGVETGVAFLGVEPTRLHRDLARLVTGYLEEHARRRGKRLWAEKTAFNVFHLETIRRLLGDRVAYVVIFRHGLDVACSIDELCRRNGTYLCELHERVRAEPRPLFAFARLWAELSQQLRDFADAEQHRCHVVRYEDLVATPELTMAGLCSFLGVAIDPSLIERALGSAGEPGLGDWKTYSLDHLSKDSIGRWRSLPRATRVALSEIVDGTLERLGYEVGEDDDGASTNADAARRRYELGLLLGQAKVSRRP